MKKTFLESFSQDPAQFIQTWLESQSRDLESILGSGPTEGQTVRQEELKRSEFFQLPWVEEVNFPAFYDLFCLLNLSLCPRLWQFLREFALLQNLRRDWLTCILHPFCYLPAFRVVLPVVVE